MLSTTKRATLYKQQGFTLLEMLLVVAIIAVLAAIVIVAINPTKQLGDTRNAQRSHDVTTILDAVYQYAIDNNNGVPSGITTTDQEICATTGVPCAGLADLGAITANSKYLVAIPTDPQCAAVCSISGTGYHIIKNTDNRVTVSAPAAEAGKTISVTR